MENKKKNYSIIIAIALIAFLVVAIVCVAASKKDNTGNSDGNNISNENVVPGGNNDDESNDLMEPDISMFPEFEVNTERDEDGNKVNISPNITEKMTFDFLDFTNISLKYADGTTTFNSTVMNNSDEDYLLGLELKITFLDNDGREIYETHMLTSALYAHKESSINTNITMDCSYADTFKVEIIKHDM